MGKSLSYILYVVALLSTIFAFLDHPQRANSSTPENPTSIDDSQIEDVKQTLLGRIDLLENEMSSMRNEFTTKISEMQKIISHFSHTESNLNRNNHQKLSLDRNLSAIKNISQLESHNVELEAWLTEALTAESVIEEAETKVSAKRALPTLHNDGVEFVILSEESTRHRALQQADISNQFDICRTGILSPINEFNNWEFDEETFHKILIIRGLSSNEDLNDIASPQFQAACWLLYRLEDVLHADDYFVQTYALAVFIYNILKEIDDMKVLNRILPNNVCNFPVFSCNHMQYVTNINFTVATLRPRGSIPTEIALLRSLESLDFENFFLTGTIPTEFGFMNLTSLLLDNNNFSGQIPSEFGRLSNLEKLSLNRNLLTGTIPSQLSKCTKLHTLILSQNSLVGTLPTEIAALSSLETLELSINNLTGSIPETFHRGFKSIKLNDNGFSGTLPHQIWEINPLRELRLGGNRLSGTLSESAKNLTSLFSLGLNNNLFEGTLPHIFDELNSLDMLMLHKNNFSGRIPDSLWNENFNFLQLFDNELTGTVPQNYCSNLFKIIVDDSPWFNDEPKVKCDCCKRVNCYVSDSETISVGEIRRAKCPPNNVHNLDFVERYEVIDLVVNETRNDVVGPNVKGTKDLCLSPSGCYSIQLSSKNNSYGFGYSSANRGLVEQESCDTVQICEHSIGQHHKRRSGMNRLTQLVVSDLDLTFHDETSPEHRAMCWLMTQDDRYFDYPVCDGTLLERYIMALFYYSQEDIFDFDLFSSEHTCDWPGIVCDVNNRFIEKLHLDNFTITSMILNGTVGLKKSEANLADIQEISKRNSLSNMKLSGPLRKEFGRLSRLKEIHIQGNNFSGTINPIMLSNTPGLEIFLANDNRFEGQFPWPVMHSEKLKEISMHQNRLIGTVMDSTQYSRNLEYFNVGENLLIGTIPSGFSACHKLRYFDVEKNALTGTIPSFISTSLENLTILKLNENKLTGQIPAIKSLGLKRLTLHSNILTGTIPAELSSLQELEIMSLHHNALQGTIPTEFEELKHLERVQFHNNLLEGIAPKIPFVGNDNFAYISDCGKISPLQCDSCTMCCDPNDADQKCRVDWDWNKILWGVSMLSVIVTVLLTLIFYIFIRKSSWHPSWLIDTSDPLEIYSEDSVYAFIFLSDYAAFSIQVAISAIQIWMYIAFIMASNANSLSTDWEFTIQCFGNSLECAKGKKIDVGWVHLGVLTMLHLGVDTIYGLRQMRKAIHLSDTILFVSGARLVCLSGVALTTSVLYNAALAETNTQMIVNAVILLFINDLDEKTLEVLYALCPKWTEEQVEEVRQIMATKVPKDINKTKEKEAKLEEIEDSVVDTHAELEVGKAIQSKVLWNGIVQEEYNESDESEIDKDEAKRGILAFFSSF